eukprot:4850343-Pleurochrysis_carterae.AAC.1
MCYAGRARRGDSNHVNCGNFNKVAQLPRAGVGTSFQEMAVQHTVKVASTARAASDQWLVSADEPRRDVGYTWSACP